MIRFGDTGGKGTAQKGNPTAPSHEKQFFRSMTPPKLPNEPHHLRDGRLYKRFELLPIHFTADRLSGEKPSRRIPDSTKRIGESDLHLFRLGEKNRPAGIIPVGFLHGDGTPEPFGEEHVEIGATEVQIGRAHV
jgi:hypothetical protein